MKKYILILLCCATNFLLNSSAEKKENALPENDLATQILEALRPFNSPRTRPCSFPITEYQPPTIWKTDTPPLDKKSK